MAKILVTEKIAHTGIDLMLEAGHQVEERLDLSPEELEEIIGNYNALIIRSATKVTERVLNRAHNLVVVGRAGIGLDNVDVDIATSRGIMVVNAPQSNIISAAEQTMALMLALARKIPDAHNSVKAGKWERSKFEGVELYSKTLGIVGLGRVGTLVAQRALSFGMKLIAYDPFQSEERAKTLGVRLVDLETLLAESDFVTIHLPKTNETVGLINKPMLSLAKEGLRIINTARGGIIDEEDLIDALKSGQIAGCALDVFSVEPPGESELLKLDNVVLTPHLGASTVEAQDKAGITVAEQVLLALEGAFVPYAVNINAKEASPLVSDFLALAEQLGAIFGKLHSRFPASVEIAYQGNLAKEDTRILTLCVLKGLFSVYTEDPVSYVNAPQLAKERGIDIVEKQSETARDYVNLISLKSSDHTISGTLSGLAKTPKLVNFDGHVIEVPPSKHMLVIQNYDKPGMVGHVGTLLGNSGIGISFMAVGPSSDGKTALMVMSISDEPSSEVIEEIKKHEGILEVHAVGF